MSRSVRRWLAIGVVGAIGLFVAFAVFADQWTQWQWFDALGFGRVHRTLLGVRAGLFGVFGVATVLLVGGSGLAAYLTRPRFHHEDTTEQLAFASYRQLVAPLRRTALIGPMVVIGIFGGVAGAAHWQQFLMWAHRVSFHERDPFLHRDVGFYVFDLPWWHYVVNFVTAGLVVALMANAFVHYLYGGIRLSPYVRRLSRPAAIQLSVLLALLLIAKSADYWLSRYDLVTDKGGLVDGMSYARDHAALASRTVLAGIALVCAALFVVTAIRRRWVMPVVAMALFGASAVFLGGLWPALVQQFKVEPRASVLERSYVAANIAATRQAYGVEGVDTVSYSAATPQSAEALGSAAANLSGLSVLDPQAMATTVRNVQQLQPWFSLPDVLDVDRYIVDGKRRAVIVAARGIDTGGVPEASRDWTGLHIKYTHGDGLVAAYADQVGDGGLPVWLAGDALGLRDPDVYFSPDATNYVFDQGSTGVRIDSPWQRLVYAVKYGDGTLLGTSKINAKSRLLADRTPLQRVEAAAPWLTFDHDAMPTVVDGRLLWVLDGYTTSNAYPQSEHRSLSDLISDSPATHSAFGTGPDDDINYIRNAVKATVDAADGTVHLYAWDENDPILRAMRAAFPRSVLPRSAVPTDLMPHLRYGDALFRAQRNILTDYHVTDIATFIGGSQRWELAPDPRSSGKTLAPQRDLLGSAPLISGGYVTATGTLAGFLQGGDDPTQPGFGLLKVQSVTASPVLGGPTAAATAFNADPRLAALRGSNTTTVIGRMGLLPIGGAVLTYEPVYVTNSSGARVLNAVAAWFGGRVGFGDTLVAAANDAVGAGPPPEKTPVSALLKQADEAFKAADAAKARGDQAGYDSEIAKVRSLLAQALSG